MKNRAQISRALLVLVIVLGLTSITLRRLPPVIVSNDFGIRPALPERIGDWVGHELLFCQNEQCLKTFDLDEVSGRTNCPVCGGPLDAWAPGEKALLPSDTRLVRRVYRMAGRPPVQVSIVFSGGDQKSIHRPQQCLRGQGLVIESSAVIDIPLSQRPALPVMVLSVRPANHGMRDLGVFGYWFIGGGRETPYHLKRLAWMSWDRLAHNRADRWAYVSLYIPQAGTMESGRAQFSGFIRQLVPELTPSMPSPSSPPARH